MGYTCWKCGKKKAGYSVSPLRMDYVNAPRFYCADCYEEIEAQRAADLTEYVRLKHKIMFERAVRQLERQRIDMYEYKEAVDAVEEFFKEKPEKFESSDEIIAAIVLTHDRVKMKWQYKIGNHRVDCYLPELKIVLEIDGHLHQYHKQRDSKRDIEIKEELGKGWEVVRIPTKYVEENAKQLLKAIIRVREDKIIGLI